MNALPSIFHALIVAAVTILISAFFYLIGAPDSLAYYASGAFAGAYLVLMFRPEK